MDVEVVTDDVPAADERIGRHDGLHMGQEIILGARGSAKRSQEFATDHVPAQNEAPCSMALVLEFASLYMAWCKRESRMLAF